MALSGHILSANPVAGFTPSITTDKRRGSADSVTTIDGDESPADGRTVPTLVEWPHGGNKVYLTGTFCGWAKRFKLTRR